MKFVITTKGAKKLVMSNVVLNGPKGKLSFETSEGGNRHCHVFDKNGNEIAYVWFDTHTSGDYILVHGERGKAKGIVPKALPWSFYKHPWKDAATVLTDLFALIN